jgi:hypothetical protein
MAPIIKLTRKTKTFPWTEECQKIEVYWNIDIDITKLACGVSCSYIYASLLVVGAMLS